MSVDDTPHIHPIAWTVSILLVLTFIVGLTMGICAVVPQYNVYRQEKGGEAEFKRAEQNRRIAVEEARAELDSAELKAAADIIRAEGIAESNAIIAETITPEYIQWRWVEGLHDGTGETIYIPTEANLPILEALRRQQAAQPTEVGGN